MASGAAPPPVPSNYQPIFEGYWKQCDPGNTGKLGAVDAASFLKSSQLKQSTLHKIWTLVDPNGRGYLEKEAFFTAIRLVAVCQNGKEPSVASIAAKDPLPVFNPVNNTSKPWIIDAEERRRSISLFNSLQPVQGKVTGDKAKQIFVKSGLSTDILGKIWTLSDVDADGALTISEFSIAIHLIGRCRGGEMVPSVLPPALKIAASSIAASPPSGRRESTVEWLITADMKAKYDQYFVGIDKDKDGFVTGEESKGLFMASNLPSSILADIWTLIDTKPVGKLNAEQFAVAMYLISEKVKGGEIPTTLPANLVPPSMRVQPAPPPAQSMASEPPTSATTAAPLTPLMPGAQSGYSSLPSSSFQPQFSSPSSTTTSSAGMVLLPTVVSAASPTASASSSRTSVGGPGAPSSGPVDMMDGFSAIKQLDSLNCELESLTKEKESLQQDVKEKEKAILESKDEVQSLKTALAKTQMTCQELGNEKMAAQGKLDSLDKEKASVEKQLEDSRKEIVTLKSSIDQVKSALQGKQEAMKAQSEQLQKLQTELRDLKEEDSQLKGEVESSRDELQKAQQNLTKTRSEITQAQKRIASLKAERKTISETFAEISNISFDTPSTGSQAATDGPYGDSLLNVRSEVDSVSAVATAGSSSPLSSLSGFSEFEHKDESTSGSRTSGDPFMGTMSDDPFSSMSGGGFTGSTSSFGSNSFNKTPTTTGFADPFAGSSDPFKTPTGGSMSNDPFGGDPFGLKSTSPSATDPFKTPQSSFSSDPFGSGGTSSNVGGGGDFFKTVSTAPGDTFSGNPFGSDSFQNKPTGDTKDPFPTGDSNTGSDPFGFGGGTKSPASKDPFSGFGSDPFSRS